MKSTAATKFRWFSMCCLGRTVLTVHQRSSSAIIRAFNAEHVANNTDGILERLVSNSSGTFTIESGFVGGYMLVGQDCLSTFNANSVDVACGIRIAVHRDHVQLLNWAGRSGNQLVGMAQALVLGEMLGKHHVQLPRHSVLEKLFDLPSYAAPFNISILPMRSLQKRLSCSRTSLGGMMCTGIRKKDYRHVLTTYIKPLMNRETRAACAAEGSGFDGVTIHMRSGDLLDSVDPEAKFAPCSFFTSVIDTNAFDSIRIITEPDLAHPCIEVIKTRYPKKKVRVQSKSLPEDVCALMTARNLVHSADSTFSKSLELLNEHLEMNFLPWTCAGVAAGNECNSTTSCYRIQGMDEVRTGANKRRFMLDTPALAVTLMSKTCEPDEEV